MSLPDLWSDCLNLLFPNLCIACEAANVNKHELFCLSCAHDLQITQYHLQYPNTCMSRLQSIDHLTFACSMYHFFPGGKVQHMIHQIKYQNRQYAAEKLGERYGYLLMEQPRLQDVDIILPVPLHRRKLRKRGFNQSACFARGLAKTMNKLWSVKNLVRTKHTQTQTGKSRYDRIQSMQDAFTVKKPGKLSGKHLLLVDDVMTTGATLEACLDELKKLPGVRLSVATMAIAE